MEKRKAVYCNGCGKKLRMVQDIIREGAFFAEQQWGYFSQKDGEIHRFCLCEACYDKLCGNFVLPAEVRKVKEYLF